MTVTGSNEELGQAMTDVTRILTQIEQGDPNAAERLLPLVYDELRKLAAAKLAKEKPGQTLQATGLVHDAYIRLVDVEDFQRWNSCGRFLPLPGKPWGKRCPTPKIRSTLRAAGGFWCLTSFPSQPSIQT